MTYKNTRIYARSLELNRCAKALIKGLPSGHGYIGDQARRAASGVLLNFAEGCGRTSLKERRRFFEIARASAYEVSAVFDLAEALGVVECALAEEALDASDHLAAMLTRFARL